MNPGVESLPLRDIHLPDGVSWWPPAVGWWIVMGLLLLIVAIIFIRRAVKRRKQFSRLALAEFDSISARYNSHGNTQKLMEDLSALLRRITISAFPNYNAAGVTGDAWLRFLDEVAAQQSAAEISARFDSPVGQWLLSAPYQKRKTPAQQDVQQLLLLCQAWIRSVSRRAKLPMTSGVH